MSCRKFLTSSLTLALLTNASFFLLLFNTPSKAYEKHGTESATIKATVPEDVATAPILVSPPDASTSNTSSPQFVFKAAVSTGGIDHYDLYVDDLVVASSISASALSEDNSSFSASQSNGQYYINLKSSIADGYHSWKVEATRVSGTTVTSVTWHFWVDTSSPQIILEKVEKQTLNWNSSDPNSFPPPAKRHLIVTTTSPLLSGKVEAYANLKITLLCPPPIGRCLDFSTLINDGTGLWSYRPMNLIPKTKYTVYLAATDSAGNITNFPQFTLTYLPKVFPIGPVTPTPTPSPSPTPEPTVTPEISPSPTPSPTPSPEPTPPVAPLPPEKPLPPPPPTTKPLEDKKELTQQINVIALLLTLLHVSLAAIGTAPVPSLVMPFLASLFIPPLGKRNDDLTLLFDLDKKHPKPLPYVSVFAYSLESIKDHLTELSSIDPKKLFATLAPILKTPAKAFLSGSTGLFNLKLKSGPFLLLARRPGFNSSLENANNNPSVITENVVLYHSEILDIDPSFSKQAIETKPSLINLNSDNFTLLVPLSEKEHEANRLRRFQSISMDSRLLPLLAALVFSIYSLINIPSLLGFSLFLTCTCLLANQYLYPSVKSRILTQY